MFYYWFMNIVFDLCDEDGNYPNLTKVTIEITDYWWGMLNK